MSSEKRDAFEDNNNNNNNQESDATGNTSGTFVVFNEPKSLFTPTKEEEKEYDDKLLKEKERKGSFKVDTFTPPLADDLPPPSADDLPPFIMPDTKKNIGDVNLCPPSPSLLPPPPSMVRKKQTGKGQVNKSPLTSHRNKLLRLKNQRDSLIKKSPVQEFVFFDSSSDDEGAGGNKEKVDQSTHSNIEYEEEVGGYQYRSGYSKLNNQDDNHNFEVSAPDKQFKKDLVLSANTFKGKIDQLGVDNLNSQEAMRMLREIRDHSDSLGVPQNQADVIGELLNSHGPLTAVLMPDLNEDRRDADRTCKKTGKWIAVIISGTLGAATVVSVPFFVLGTIAEMMTGNANLTFKDLMSLENGAIYAVGVPTGILGWLGLAPFFGYNLYKSGRGFVNASWKQKLFSIGIHSIGFVSAAGLGNSYFIQNFWQGVSTKVPVSDPFIHTYTWGSMVIASIGNVEGVKFYASTELPRTVRWLVRGVQDLYQRTACSKTKKPRYFSFFPHADKPGKLNRKKVLKEVRHLCDYMAEIYDLGMSDNRIKEEKLYHKAMPMGSTSPELENILAYLQGIDNGFPSVRFAVYRGVFEPLSVLLAVAGNYNFLYQGEEAFNYLFRLTQENGLAKLFGGLTFAWNAGLWYFLLRDMLKEFVRPLAGRCDLKKVGMEYLLPLAPAAALAVTNIFLTLNNPELPNWFVKLGVMSSATLGGFLLSRFGIANGLRDALDYKDKRQELVRFADAMYKFFVSLPDKELFESYALVEPYVNKLSGLDQHQGLLDGQNMNDQDDDDLGVIVSGDSGVVGEYSSISSEFEVEEEIENNRWCVMC